MTRDQFNLTADETAILDDMLARRETTFQKPPYMPSPRATRLKMIAREEIAALPPKKAESRTGRTHYQAGRRVAVLDPTTGRPNKYHEADADGLPICQMRTKFTGVPEAEIQVLGPGDVTCGHCANATVRL